MEQQKTDSEAAARIGTIVADRYTVLSHLGSGGTGTVYLAEDRALKGEHVVLKLLHPNYSRGDAQLARFKNEVLLARKLAHPNIVRVFDYGSADGGQYYITMEYVDGQSLGYHIRNQELRGQLTFDRSVQIIYSIIDALHYAHGEGVIHRDLKPDNVLLSERGELKLTDFGVARSLAEDKGLTMTGEIVGTPYYMAPEQIRGEKVDVRTDIYALGIFSYELTTGTRPFNHENYMALCAMHMTEEIPRFAGRKSGIPGWFQDFVETCAEKDPADRFQSMAEVAEALSDYVPRKSSLGSSEPSGKPATRSRLHKLRNLFGRKGV